VGEDLAAALQGAGASVDQVVAYRTVQAAGIDPEIAGRLAAGEVDFVTFTSSSTVQNLLAALGGRQDLLGRAIVVSIGPVTSRTARDAGLEVGVEAGEHTVPGLVAALAAHVGERKALP
jgi:uroporphyrinogen-III synthase